MLLLIQRIPSKFPVLSPLQFQIPENVRKSYAEACKGMVLISFGNETPGDHNPLSSKQTLKSTPPRTSACLCVMLDERAPTERLPSSRPSNLLAPTFVFGGGTANICR